MKSNLFAAKRTLGSKKGMTLVELLVSLTLLMLIILTFTPLFVQNFRNIRTAGEVTSQSYEKASLLERLIANKGNNAAGYEISVSDVPIEMSKEGDASTSISFGENTSAGVVNGTIIASNPYSLNSYSTFYTNDNTSRMLCFPNTLNDDFLTKKITVVPKGFKFNSAAENKNADQSGWHFRIRVTDSNGNKKTVDKQYYDIQYKKDGSDTVAEFTLKGGNDVICFENSPLYIEYGQGVADLQYSVKVEIGAPEIIFVGEQASDGEYYYYTTSGVDVDSGKLDLIAKKMSGDAELVSAMNDVEWVAEGKGDNGKGGVNEYGYYVMGGDAGQIRRFWKQKDYIAGSDSENYCWGGDNVVNYSRYAYLDKDGNASSDSYETLSKTKTTQAQFKSIFRSGQEIVEVDGVKVNQLFNSTKAVTVTNNGYKALSTNYFTANVTAADYNNFFLTLGVVAKIENKYEYYGADPDASKSEYKELTSWLTGGDTYASKLNVEGYKEATDYEYADDTSLITITSVGAIQINSSNSNYIESQGNTALNNNVYPTQSYTLYCGYIPAVIDTWALKNRAFMSGYNNIYGHAATIGAVFGDNGSVASWYPAGKFGDIHTTSTAISTSIVKDKSELSYEKLLNFTSHNSADKDTKYPYTGKKNSTFYKAGQTVEGVTAVGLALPAEGNEYYITASEEVDVSIGYLSHPFAICLANPAYPIISGATGSDYYFKKYVDESGKYDHSFYSSGLRDNVTMLDVASYHDDITGNNISIAVGYSLGYIFNDAHYQNHLGQVMNTGVVYIRSSGDGDEKDTVGSLESGKGWSMKKETNVFHQFYGIDQYQDGTGTVAALGWDTYHHRAYYNISTDDNSGGDDSKYPGGSDSGSPIAVEGDVNFGTNSHPMAQTECTTVRWGLTWDVKPQVMWGTKNGSMFSWNYDYENPKNSKITSVTKEFESYLWADRIGETKPIKSSANKKYHYDYTSVNAGTSDEYGFISCIESITDVEYGDNYWVVCGTQSGKAPSQYCASNKCYSGNGQAASYINVKYCYNDESNLYAWKAVAVSQATNVNFISITYSQGVWYLTGYVDSNGNGENDLNEKAVIYYSKDPSDANAWKLARTQRKDGSYNSTSATALYFDTSGNKKEIDLTGVNAMASQG